jgi:hypothetical protein
LAERRAALRRAVSDLGEVTTRFRSRLAESGVDAALAATGTPPAPSPNGSAPNGVPPASAPGAPPRSTVPPLHEQAAPAPAQAGVSPGHPSPALAQRERALAEARQRFESASRLADDLVRTIAEAVDREKRAFDAEIETSVEARWREVEIEAQRRLRRAETEAAALVEQRRRRIAEVSERILEFGETLAERLAEADQVKDQFDAFVRSLSEASDRLARDDSSPRATVGTISGYGDGGASSGLAEAA